MSNDTVDNVAPKRKRTTRAKKTDTPKSDTAPKKRGRKPKGGKVVKAPTHDENVIVPAANVILHLKCGTDDLKSADFFSTKCYEYDPTDVSGKIDPYEAQPTGGFESVPMSNQVETKHSVSTDTVSNKNDDMDTVITQKLRTLARDLHTNNISDKKAACFHCYVTSTILQFSYQNMKSVTAITYTDVSAVLNVLQAIYFQQRDIDPSTRFERYALLNHIYCKIYDYKKNIKPAPDPHYTLDKFFGNLTIQEYRAHA